ncbi:CoA-binding protein [Candidatus Desulfarcum epimagneticum]|uniref:CoA-binding protein n=1 Tax=uncultured Desulfobacteraceae bacterium TaxID=218296 RepID=A0A484HIV7_9BACT|nr:CoA-binding protein [uncultured Desulfobacteraceae bacterium]
MEEDEMKNDMTAGDGSVSVLDEHESKALLRGFGVPVVPERVARDEKGAVLAAEKTGFPVTLKGLGKAFSHKTESGLVRLNLNSAGDVRRAAASVKEKGGADLDILVQPHVSGKREFMAGVSRDSQFGHVIMFGLGGVFAEALSDVSLRVAPLTKNDISEMMDEISAADLLGPWRGEKAVSRDQMARVLSGLSDLCRARPDLFEADINPLIADSEGDIVAVDALVTFREKDGEEEPSPPVDPRHIGALFYPRSIAFIGASSELGKWGNTLLTYTLGGGFKGDVYPVNPKGGTICGQKAYPSVLDIPAKVDLAVVTIPADKVLALLPDLKKKGITNMLLISSGFSEIGPEGREMEKRFVAEARRQGVVMLGPNTMGICNPHIDLYCAGSPVMPPAGSTAMVAQSGNMGVQLLGFAENQGIGIRAFSGSGNEAMITIEDYLDGFEIDEMTRVVMLYVESVKNGARFFESARRVGKKKPVILLKGGRTSEGNRAAASHTGALASDIRVFNAACRQAGVIQADYSMDLLDLTAAFSSLPLPKGNRVGIMTLGGGWGVVTADLCVENGIDIPDLPEEIIGRLDRILPPYWSRANPIDIVGERDPSIPLAVMEELMKWDGCDAVINLGIVGRKTLTRRLFEFVRKTDPDHSEEFLSSAYRMMTDFEKDYMAHIAHLMKTHQKPVYGVSIIKEEKDRTVYSVDGCRHKGVFFPTPERAVKAFGKMWEYQRFLSKNA